MPEPTGLDSLTALLLLRQYRARATWGDGFVKVEAPVDPRDVRPGPTWTPDDLWREVARESTFVHAVMSARDACGWALAEGGKA